MNNGMPNNFNNSNLGGNDPLANQAASNLMGGQSDTPSNVNPMMGEDVIPTPSAFQGLSNVTPEPSVMQGNATPNVVDVPSMPGQGNSGVNAFTMQSEPMNNTDNVMSNNDVVGQAPVNNMNAQNSFDAFDRINAEVINNDPANMNQADLTASLNNQVMNDGGINTAPALNSTLLGAGNIPSDATIDSVNMQENVMQSEPNFNQAPQDVVQPEPNFNQMPQNNLDNNFGGGSALDSGVNNSNGFAAPAAPQNMDNNIGGNTDFGMNQPNMNNQIGQPQANNQIGDVNMVNSMMGSAASEPVGAQQQNFGYEQQKKFPLSVREIVLIAIALIGVIFVVGMYGFGWFK